MKQLIVCWVFVILAMILSIKSHSWYGVALEFMVIIAIGMWQTAYYRARRYKLELEFRNELDELYEKTRP